MDSEPEEAQREAEVQNLWNFGFDTIKELETENGILASGKEEIFGCIFGRDSLITSLKLLRVYQKTQNPYFLALVKKVLLNLLVLQGKEINIESGEEPGKCIHEYRPKDHERLTKYRLEPWYVYPDNVMRNYDTVDATPLLLITLHRYYEITKDREFLNQILPGAYAALHWLLLYGDSNGDGFIDYRFHEKRKFGGLRTQSWMDSRDSVFFEAGGEPVYPIAPVEVQAYSYLAMRLWAKQLQNLKSDLSHTLESKAQNLKNLFNEKFLFENEDGINVAFALDGNGQQLTSARSSIGHVLWAAFTEKGAEPEAIISREYVPFVAQRLMQPDLFVPEAGIRTLSSKSTHFQANSYHNGSIWPHDTSIIIEGLKNFGYFEEAQKVKQAILKAFNHFKTPIELFTFAEHNFSEYENSRGQKACRKQAWSAASLLSEVA